MMADDIGPETGQVLSPRAQAALLGDTFDSGDDDEKQRREDEKQRRELFRQQLEEEQQFSRREEQDVAKSLTEKSAARGELIAAQAEQTRIGNRATERYLQSQQNIPPAPSFNGSQAQQDAMSWLNLAAGLGAIGGGLVRGGTTTAMNAMAGMMNGAVKGELQGFETNYKIWQANNDRVSEYNARAAREYKAIMDNAKMNVDQKANLVQMTAEKWQDQMMADNARGRHIERMTQLIDARERYEENLRLNRDKMAQHHDEFNIKTKIDLAKGGAVLHEDGSIGLDTSPGSPGYKRAEQIARYNQAMPNNPGGRYAGMFNELSALVDDLSMKINGAHYDATRFTGKQAYARTAGTYGARVETATNEVALLLPQALDASKQEPRGRWVPINKLVQDVQAGKSDPRYYDFAFANLTLINAYGRAVNPTGVARLEDKAHAAQLMSTVTDQASYERVLLRMAKEVRASHAAVALTRGDPDASINATQNIMRMSDQQLEQYIIGNAPQANTVASGKLDDVTANRTRITIPRATPPDEDSEFPGFSVVPQLQ